MQTQSHTKGAISQQTYRHIFKDGKKVSYLKMKVSVLFVQTLQVIIINVNQMLDLLTLGTCHVIQHIKRAKDGT